MAIAGASTCASESVPNRASASMKVPGAAGTVAARRPSPGIMPMPCPRNQSMVAARGAHPWPLMATARFCRAE